MPTTKNRDAAEAAASTAATPVTADSVCVKAVDLARDAAAAMEGADRVGEHLGHDADAERVVTHYFTSLNPAYVGWRWAVTVARASRAKVATVDEVVLLPGSEALLAPAWVPFDQRLRPGDLGVGDLLPTPADDPRLVPGYTAADESLGELLDDPLAPPAWEIGLGRVRVMSEFGRDDAADRWQGGDTGPRAPMAVAAQAPCSSCGFLVALGGSLRQSFGVCANVISPTDGRVVSFDFGCGAHSETVIVMPPVVVVDHVVDEVGFDVLTVHESVDSDSAGSVEPEAPAEELGHS